MGQKHILVNFSKKEKVDPQKIGLGYFQYEHTYACASLSDVLYLLLCMSPGKSDLDLCVDENLEYKFKTFGRWIGDIIAVFGDETEPKDTPFYGLTSKSKLQSHVKNFKDISDDILPAFELAFEIDVDRKKGLRDRELIGEDWSFISDNF